MNSSGDDPAITVAQSLCAQHVPDLKALHIWSEGYGSGLELVTSHYRVFTSYLDVGLLKRLPRFMESAHRAYNELLADPVSPQTQSVIYLFDHRHTWERFTRAFTGEQAEVLCKIQQGAYCYKGACVAYDIGMDRTLAALAHEGWHQFMTRHFAYRLPSWLDEGLAMQFESFHWQDGDCFFRRQANVYRLEGLRYQLSQPVGLTVEQLLATSPGEVMTQDGSESVIGLYSQSYALVRFLDEGQRGAYKKGLQHLLSDGMHARWPLNADQRYIAADRNQPRTLSWNRQVGRQLFLHYIHPEPAAVEAPYRAFCHGLVESPLATAR